MPKTLLQMWALFERQRPRKLEEYFSLCLQLDGIDEASQSARLRDVIAIVELEEPEETLTMLMDYREEHCIPKIRFWWWIDFLQAGKL